MGKASKWFRGLLGLRRPDSPSPTAASAPKPAKEKRRWSFVKSYREKDSHHATATKPAEHHARAPYGELPVQSSGPEESADPDKHAMAVAAADPDKHAMAVAATTAAVAEAAVASAHAAAAVVRLTSSGRCAGTTADAESETAACVAGGITREEWAAVKIQAAFRGCLARRALRALKGLVKLQALVRGHIERKRTVEWLQRMQALLRAQARVRAGRAQILQTSYWNAKSSTVHIHGPATPDKFESPIKSESMKYDQPSVLKRSGSKSRVQINGKQQQSGTRSDSWVDEQSWNQRRSWMRTCSMDDERSVRILEIDSGKPHITPKRRNLFYSTSHALASDHYSQSLTTTKDSTSYQSGQSPSSCEVQSCSPLKTNEVEESTFCTADNSPQYFSASSKDGGSKRSPFTPSRSDGSRSYLSGYSDYFPSYMAYTESSKAKARSLSAPKQRPQFERSSSSNRYSLHGLGETRMATQRVSAMHASFASKAYPGSGRLDKLGMPVGHRH